MWQSIETAPKDGTRILVVTAGQDDHEVVYWMEPGWFNGDVILDADMFTHWMVPPKAPPAD